MKQWEQTPQCLLTWYINKHTKRMRGMWQIHHPWPGFSRDFPLGKLCPGSDFWIRCCCLEQTGRMAFLRRRQKKTIFHRSIASPQYKTLDLRKRTPPLTFLTALLCWLESSCCRFHPRPPHFGCKHPFVCIFSVRIARVAILYHNNPPPKSIILSIYVNYKSVCCYFYIIVLE